MDKWLATAVDYIPSWLQYQMRQSEQPGCAIAITHKGRLVLDVALGHADLDRGLALTPNHRFRVASHSKSFTAAAVMKLREKGLLNLDQPVHHYVQGLHPKVGAVTIGQLLSHSAGIVRDGSDAGQWVDRRAFLSESEIRADLADGLTIEPNTRFKYSNHGYALAGMVIEAVTQEKYAEWVLREIIAPSKLEHTQPDAPLTPGTAFARGHSNKALLGRRVVIPGENPTNALASATGFISTAGDLARFYASLAPAAKGSVLSPASRREMARRLWRDPQASVERWYGLGLVSGTLADWDWFGHTGGFQGYITRTVCVPDQDLSVSVLTNAADGLSHVWLEGALHILRACQRNGGPSRHTAPWTGRWWSMWATADLLAVRDKVMVLNPALTNPVLEASEFEVTAPRKGAPAQGRIIAATGFANYGETVRMERDARGRATKLWLGGGKLQPQAQAAAELSRRYGKKNRK